jgi:membrane-associated HD superfamily phosphohydrolase
MHISESPALTVSEVSGSSFKNSDETKRRAYSGHLLNQSKVQQLTREGNYLHLILKVSPTGDMQRQICKFSLTLEINKAYILSIVSTIFLSLHTTLTPLFISSVSSGCIKLGISPVFKRLFKFSIKLSLMI